MREPEMIRGDILLVDDRPENLRLLSDALAACQHEVRAVLSGAAALSAIQSEPPDLILLDIKMPEMDGYEVCRQLKADANTRDIPVIFLSALDDPFDKVKAFQVGGADYITKPFHAPEVLARVQKQLAIELLQRQLTARNEALSRSNRDLEQFAFMVSHDLKQPLQSILGFARLLALKYQNQLDDTGTEYVCRLAESANHMNELIEDVLTFSRVGQAAATTAMTDCDRVLEQVLANLHVAIAEADARVTYASLPAVRGDSSQWVALFQNLVGNAIKFRRPGVAPHIEIAAERSDRQWRFVVRDNGIGIPLDQRDRIFQAFARGHARGDYPGTGIGLAICQKAIERSGGQIWVESEVGVGTSVIFTVPADLPAAPSARPDT
ncbi:MAG: response regulator [Cyanobacteria bacterium J06648_11]